MRAGAIQHQNIEEEPPKNFPFKGDRTFDHTWGSGFGKAGQPVKPLEQVQVGMRFPRVQNTGDSIEEMQAENQAGSGQPVSFTVSMDIQLEARKGNGPFTQSNDYMDGFALQTTAP